MWFFNFFKYLTFNIVEPANNIENFVEPANNIEKKNFHIWHISFNIGEVRNTIESYEYQCVTFSILVIKVLFPN
ncbi:hypothetical protein LTSEUGA_0118 [Salmonella enterica subsp. enterica serovar Uganda str. R8-3404]|uniref:Uncharacterized protein n=1 Tax=Salmonella enterica subsp. enterica serovar Uganda str. R8-3404 TaxID=913083 RepID=A0A6C8H7H5_SALET|nr:hypothetical protein LTSEUGA_0118 [Salmonella enterica subsp. enterica serovar Uganda str. R8-3404]